MGNTIKILVTLILVVSFASCGVKARAYKERRERPDQAIAGVEPETPKTREVFVFEFVKDKKEEPKPRIEVTTPEYETEEVPSRSLTMDDLTKAKAPKESAPAINFADNVANTTGFEQPSLPAQYTVQKDDTLQSISKKFYNSFSKWPKIYEVNKDKISDPNRIKTGITLTIPEL